VNKIIIFNIQREKSDGRTILEFKLTGDQFEILPRVCRNAQNVIVIMTYVLQSSFGWPDKIQTKFMDTPNPTN